ncbi:MAG: hypothetical protein ACYDBS_05290 [Acidimicrobiales bacterium]
MASGASSSVVATGIDPVTSRFSGELGLLSRDAREQPRFVKAQVEAG